MTRWKIKFMSVTVSKRPNSCASALKECDKDAYPNVYILSQIARTLPVSSCNANEMQVLCVACVFQVCRIERRQTHFFGFNAHSL